MFLMKISDDSVYVTREIIHFSNVSLLTLHISKFINRTYSISWFDNIAVQNKLFSRKPLINPNHGPWSSKVMIFKQFIVI